MIRHKLRLASKIEQFNSCLIAKTGGEKTQNHLDRICDNHWLAGFIQGDGSFQIQINNREKFNLKNQIIIAIQISQKTDYLLRLIKDTFGGVIYYYEPQDFYFYTSSSFGNAMKFIEYLDRYQVIGPCF